MVPLDRIRSYIKSQELVQAHPIQVPGAWFRSHPLPIPARRIQNELSVDFFQLLNWVLEQAALSARARVCRHSIYSICTEYTSAWQYNGKDLQNGTLIRNILLLPMIRDLGFEIVYLLPIFQTSSLYSKGDMPSPFCIQSHYKLNPFLKDPLFPDFSADEQFALFTDTCKAFGLKVIVEAALRTGARDHELTESDPLSFAWIESQSQFFFPSYPSLDRFERLRADNMEAIFQHPDTKHYLKQFRYWEPGRKNQLLPSPAFSDVINDGQQLWEDVTFFNFYSDCPTPSGELLPPDQAPYSFYDKLNPRRFPGKVVNRKLWDYLIGAMDHWLRNFAIDGFRIDMAQTLPPEFMLEVAAVLQSHVTDPILIKESFSLFPVSDGVDPAYTHNVGFSVFAARDFAKAVPPIIDFFCLLEAFPRKALGALEIHDSSRIFQLQPDVRRVKTLLLLFYLHPKLSPFLLGGFEARDKRSLSGALEAEPSGLAPSLFHKCSVPWQNADGDLMNFVAACLRFRSQGQADSPEQTLCRTFCSSSCVSYRVKSGRYEYRVICNLTEDEQLIQVEDEEHLALSSSELQWKESRILALQGYSCAVLRQDDPIHFK